MRFYANSTTRKHFLITLSHAEKRDLDAKEIVRRITNTYRCEAVIVARERHEKEGFHIAVKCDGASKNTATKKIRAFFPEFDGMQCNIQFRKERSHLSLYLKKRQGSAHCWAVFEGSVKVNIKN